MRQRGPSAIPRTNRQVVVAVDGPPKAGTTPRERDVCRQTRDVDGHDGAA